MPAMRSCTPTPASATDRRLLMSMRDIAELAGVHRPVVTVWRRRHADFPASIDGDVSRPLFDPRQVADWLIATGRADRDTINPDLSLYTISSLGGWSHPSGLIAVATSLICLRHLDEDQPLADGTDDVVTALRQRAVHVDPENELLLSEIQKMPDDAGWLAVALDDLIEAAWGCRGAFEKIMAARHRLAPAGLFISAVRPDLARLMVRISGATERARRHGSIVVADLSAGPGDLLTAMVEELGADYAPMCVGAEADRYLARLTRRRLVVHGLPVLDVDVSVADTLPDACGEPDVIVTQVPYTPGEDRSADAVLDVIDDVSLRLRPGCTAVVMGPADILTGDLQPYSEAERARTRLLKSGVVESVIKLPGGVIPFRPGYETALWVLGSAPDSPWRGRVLLADVSDRELTDDRIEALVNDVITWRRGGYDPDAHVRTFAVQVLISDLVEPPKPLTVRRPRSVHTAKVDADNHIARVLSLETELNRIGAYATAVRQPIRSNLVADVRARPAAISIGKLAEGRERALSLLKGTRVDPSDVTADGQHPVIGADEVLGLRRPGTRTLDRAVLATRYPRAELTEPGDVLVTTAPGFGVLIDHEGFSVAEFPVRVLRIRDSGLIRLTPHVLAAMLGIDGPSVRPAGSVRAARRIEEHRVPVLRSDEVTRFDMLLAELDTRRNQARQEIDTLDELARIATAGLCDGTLALAGDTT
jgi:hypothetical protein